MSKNFIDRINHTLNQVVEWKDQLFVGYDENKIRQILLSRVRDHYSTNFQGLSNLLSLGGVRIIKYNKTKTATRHLKRLTLLFHRVLCYHTDAETLALKNTIKNHNQTDSLAFARRYTQLGIQYLINDEKWANEIPVRYGGKLVKYYNQGKDDRLNKSDLTENGWCLGMSVHWLGCKAQLLEFWENHNSVENARSYRFVMAAQSIRGKGLHGATYEDRATFRLKRFGLKKVATKTEVNHTASGLKLAQNIVNSVAPYCRIGQLYKGGGGHAMAACLKDGGVYFLDPNLGEFYFKKPSHFVTWFPLFTCYMNYLFSRHYVESFDHIVKNNVPNFLKTAMQERRLGMGYDDDEDDFD